MCNNVVDNNYSLNQSCFSTRMVCLEYTTENQEHALCMSESLLGRNVVHYERQVFVGQW